MIMRIFQVTIFSEMREEFERDFNSISISSVAGQDGMESVFIGSPSKYSPDEYSMITYWSSEDDLKKFAGEEWNKPVIPDEMERYVRDSSVAHYVIG